MSFYPFDLGFTDIIELQEQLNYANMECDGLRAELDEIQHGFESQRYATVVALKENDDLRKQLEVAVEAMRRIPHNANHTKHFACHGCEMDEALAEIEKVGKDE